MNLKNLNIARKLAISFGLVAALLLTLATLAYVRIHAISDSVQFIGADHYPKTVLAHTIKDELGEVAVNMRNVLLMTDPAAIRAEYDNSAESTRIIGAAMEKLDATVHSPAGRAALADVVSARGKFVAARERFFSLTKLDKLADATVMLNTEVLSLQRGYFAALDKFVEIQSQQMEESTALAEAMASSAATGIALLAIAALACSGVVGYLSARSITVPLRQAVGVAQRVAAGDLSSTVEVTSRDETGQLMQALKDMNGALVTIVGEVRSGTDAIATASSQIASGNLDLSGRTEQQASALEETAASMEEMTSTTRHNADNARQANVLAASAQQVAARGGAVVAQVVGTMGEINAASKKIVDIISVIDGIAFQTNILALNAAVEAARAGEQGRGFAVVASEVRTLAQRSAAAAKEIKTLIDDSVQKVDFGSRLVGDAGATMEEIVTSVQRVTDIMGEISSASHEQESGIGQINQAVAEMDTVTQQNAALVEEAAAAAAALQDQSASLARVVSVFKLGADTRPAPPRTVTRPPVRTLMLVGGRAA